MFQKLGNIQSGQNEAPVKNEVTSFEVKEKGSF